MIPLGSCTMKLNATAEMEPITWPEFAGIHPFAPLEQAPGYVELITSLEALAGGDHRLRRRVAAAQRRLPGRVRRPAGDPRLPASRGEQERDVCLIPSSAHGTNAASAVMAGMRVVVVACDERGNVDLDDLRAKARRPRRPAGRPDDHLPVDPRRLRGDVAELCALVHDAGGQVYVDGANLNALVGLAKPGQVRRRRLPPEPAQDLLHPARRRRPGRGPGRRCARTWRRSCPDHPLRPEAGPAGRGTGRRRGPGRGAPWGSAGILPIPWAYIRLMGAEGLDPGHPGGGAVGQLHRPAPGRALPGALHRPGRAGRPRVHPRPARAHQGAPASPSTTSPSG